MKIAWTTYPLAALPGAAKRTVSIPVGDGRLAPDTSLLSTGPGVAALKYLRAIEEMASEIMKMTGGRLPAAVDEYPGQAPADASPGSVVARGDILVFFPGPEGGGERGELVVVKGADRPEGTALTEGSREQAPEAAAKDVAKVLARLGRSIGSTTPDGDPSGVREKFIISVDTVDGAPFPIVISHAPSGAASVSDNGGGELSGGAIPEEVAAIAGLLSSGQEEIPMEHLRRPPGASSGPEQALKRQETVGSAQEDLPRITVRSFLSDPGAAMKGVVRVAQRFLAISDDEGEKREAGDAQVPAASFAPVSPAMTAPGGPVSVKVTFMGHPAQAAQAETDVAHPMVGQIAGKVAALSEAVNEIITGSTPDMGPRGDGGQRTETDGEGRVPMREAMKSAVAASFAGALKELAGMDGHAMAKPLGISLDERGLLKVDTAVLRDALSTGKGKTVRFVHGLTASLHDRIAYNPLAFAGLPVGSREAALEAPSGKERASGDDRERQVDFEKRLNEIRMLLKSSYELKDSFMRGKFTGGNS